MRKNETSNGKKGGLLKGKAHYDKNGKPLGGIKAVVTDTNTPVELEGGEVIINKYASKKYWKELSKINQSAGNGVPINNPNGGDDEDPEEYKDGGRIIDFNPNHLPNKRILTYAKKIKADYPKVWDLGGNIFGNEAFKNLQRVSERGYWLESEKWMYIKWRSFVARHTHDFRIKGVIAMLKWVDKVDKGWDYMKDLIESEIEKKYPSKMEKGGQIKDLINNGIVELKMFDTKIEHAREYGLDAKNPLYIQSIYIDKNQRLKGIGTKVLNHIDEYAIKNGNDVIFGHITQKAEITKDSRNTTSSNVDILKNWLKDNGYIINNYNNDFYKYVKNEMEKGGELIKRADGTYSKRGLWDNIRDNIGSGKKPTKQMLEQEKKIKAKMKKGGNIEDNIDQLVGRYVDYYFVGRNHFLTNKIESVEITPSKYSKREVKISTEDMVYDIFPLSKLSDFMNGKEIKISGADEPYTIALKNIMGKGGKVKTDKSNDDVSEENAEMVRNQNKQILHHTEELKKVLESGVDVPAWVVAKINRATNDMSDATHFLDGTLRYAYGGDIKSGQVFDWTKYGVENTIAVTEVKDDMVFYRFNGVPKVRGTKEFIKLLEEHNLKAGFQFKQGGELGMGVKEEKEHINTAKDLYERKITPSESAERIAKEHLKEDPNYYTKLKNKGLEYGGALVEAKDKVDMDTKSDIFVNSIIFKSELDYVLGGFNVETLNRIVVKDNPSALSMPKLEIIFSDRLEFAIESFKDEIATNLLKKNTMIDSMEIESDMADEFNNLFETYLGFSHYSTNTKEVVEAIKRDISYITWMSRVEKGLEEFRNRLRYQGSDVNHLEQSKISVKEAEELTINSTFEQMLEKLFYINEENTI